MSARPKPLLIPWLREQVSSGRYPGVAWTNQEQTEFCIPWKHKLRQDSSSDDVLIFKAWNEASNGQSHSDPSIWKRNFRAALRAKGFQNVSDNKNDTANPHKVYRWPDHTPAAGSQDPEPDLYQDPGFQGHNRDDVSIFDDIFLPSDNMLTEGAASTINQDILQECLQGLNILEPVETVVVPVYDPMNHLIGEAVSPMQQQYQGATEGVIEGPQQQPMGGAEGVGGAYYGLQQREEIVSRTMEGDHFKTQYRVTVFYRGVKVSEQLVENEAGFRLVYRPELTQPVLDPDSGLSLVSLPAPGPVLDQTQAKLTQQILAKLGEGVEVGVSGSVVYGFRRGDSRAFWSLDKFDRSGTPQEVSKLQPDPLYLSRDFFGGLSEFISRGGGECPSFSLFFCLGEKWPDPDRRPWEKKLIMIEVVLTTFELLKMMAQAGGASSLQSMELQTSLQEMMELC